MNFQAQENLEWSSLVTRLSTYAQTAQGRDICLSIPLDLTKDDIEAQWSQQIAIKNIVRSGYSPPIGDLELLEPIFRGAALGQILDGLQFRSIWNLLCVSQRINHFLGDFKDRCPPLNRFSSLIYPLPKLKANIERSIGEEGEILDTASPELARIRKVKLSLRKTIEKQIRSLLVDQNLETYLQDKFFTIRAERYVVPIKLDGRGRVKGSIYDTSDSGQTLYIEPSSIAPLNENLLELELSEKLEILRIFRELSGEVAEEVEILRGNYQHIIELDVLTAKSTLAHKIDAGPIKLSGSPVMDLKGARHPLLHSEGGNPPVGNSISLEAGKQTTLIVSGPNAGGKTIVLKTAGLVHLMAKAGLLIPADADSTLFLFTSVFVAMGDPQSIEANLSTFSGHLLTLKPILEQADRQCLVLLDELAVGTEPQTGSAIAQAVLEELANQSVLTIATTHFDGLKSIAVTDQRFRNGSMEFSVKSLKPTYNLILDVPGQSYGIEVARQLGLPDRVINRAATLRGNKGSDLDHLIRSLSGSREEVKEEAEKLRKERLKLSSEQSHWEAERKALEGARQKAANQLAKKMDLKTKELRSEMEESLARVKKLIKSLEERDQLNPESRLQSQNEKKNLKDTLSQMESEIDGFRDEYKAEPKELPGQPCQIEHLKEGSRVFIVSLGREGIVTKVQEGSAPVEVQAGLLKLRPNIKELRLLDPSRNNGPKKPRDIPSVKGTRKSEGQSQIPFTPQTQGNTLDVRGMDQQKALDLMWGQIDKAVLSGQGIILIVHGHGTDALKRAIRTALAKESPYELDFRQGLQEEGGDGVTVVRIND